MANWIGPALVAAVIAAFVSVAGWFVTAGLSVRSEHRKRQEKTRDFQVALRAEIRSELAELSLYESLQPPDPSTTAGPERRLFVPRGAPNRIYDAILKDLHILPEAVIEPVVLYARQRDIIDGLREDIRSDRFSEMAESQKDAILQDYLRLRGHLTRLAQAAVEALSRGDEA